MKGQVLSRRRLLQTAAIGGLGVVAGTGLVSSDLAEGATPDLAPEGGPVKFGCFSEPEGAEKGYIASLEALEANIGRPVAIYRSYRNWGQPIINGSISRLMQRTTVPTFYFTVHSFASFKAGGPMPWSNIFNGLVDPQIDSYAAELASILELTNVYFVFHHEPENEVGKCGTPDDFQAAYWYFRRRVEVVNGVTGLTWNITLMRNTFYGKNGGPDLWWPAESPYDDVADDHLLATDPYNRYRCYRQNWRSIETLVGVPWQYATDQGRNFFLGELGCVEGDDCGGTLPNGTEKGDWYDEVLTYFRDWGPANGMSPLEALCYSNIVGYNGASYRIDTSPYALARMTSLANDPFFSG